MIKKSWRDCQCFLDVNERSCNKFFWKKRRQEKYRVDLYAEGRPTLHGSFSAVPKSPVASLAARLKRRDRAGFGGERPSALGVNRGHLASRLAGRNSAPGLPFQIWSSSNSEFRKFDFKFPIFQVFSIFKSSSPNYPCIFYKTAKSRKIFIKSNRENCVFIVNFSRKYIIFYQK